MIRLMRPRAISRMVRLRRIFGALHAALLKGAVTQGPDVPCVALTFDDGPDPAWTPKMLDILDTFRARATFFVLGEKVAAHRRLAKTVVKRGHELASHLFSHDRNVADDSARFRDEMTRTAALIAEVAGAPPRFMRFPFAYMGCQRPDAVRVSYGMDTVHWSFSGMDSRKNAAKIVKRVGRRLYPGAIVLLHDGVGNASKYVKNRQTTVDALPAVLQSCLDKGLEPVTLSNLMGFDSLKGKP
jgi:peptidoglycan/xylan/chitin deacetylase (PgdA/CDA1 family)